MLAKKQEQEMDINMEKNIEEESQESTVDSKESKEVKE